jgi:hypothetical protein
MYQYKMVQVPAKIQVRAKNHQGNEAAVYLEGIVNEHARDGWEFYRIDEIGVSLKSGFLAAIVGFLASIMEEQEKTSAYYVVSFRKPQ